MISVQMFKRLWVEQPLSWLAPPMCDVRASRRSLTFSVLRLLRDTTLCKLLPGVFRVAG